MHYNHLFMDIININVGQTGAAVGSAFLQRISSEHSLPQHRHSAFFTQGLHSNLKPRSLLVDMGQTYPSAASNIAQFYKPQNVLIQNSSSMGLFGEAKYNCNPSFRENIENTIQSELEMENSVKGMLLVSSLAEGTGSGLTSFILNHFRENHSDFMVQTFRQLPLIHQACHPLEIYNATFALHDEVEYSDMTLLFSQDAVARQLVAQGNLRPSNLDISRRVGSAIASCTVPYRFKGDLNTCQRKIASNLVLFPRLHFLAFALSSRGAVRPISSALQPSNCFISEFLDKQPGLPVLSMYAGVRSSFQSEVEVVQTIRSEFNIRHHNFQSWVPNNIHLSLHDPLKGVGVGGVGKVGQEGVGEEAVLFINSHHFTHTFRTLGEKFTASFRRKAFLHHYTGIGMDEMEFTEAESNLSDLTVEYQPPHIWEDEGEEEEDNNTEQMSV